MDRAFLSRSRQHNVLGGRVGGRHVVKVTPEEELLLQSHAEKAGVTVARLMVEAALTPERSRVPVGELTELFALTRLVGALGSNINQMAKVANSTGEIPPEAFAAFDAVRRTCRRLDLLAHEVSGR